MNESTLFERAIDIADAEQRACFLDEACLGNPALRQRLQALLANADQSFTILDQGPSARVSFLDAAGGDSAGTMIGQYKLIAPLGEGGMGSVWLAEQQTPIVRRVALKLIRPELTTRQLLARFEAERQALAILNHPNVASILDAGADHLGRPYFVMEFVDGLHITQYCNDQRLSLRDRLKLFIAVCQAVQHAHQKGVIHRDLKPSNVLVTVQDGEHVPKIIDFGLAKALHEPFTDHSLATRVEQILGTLEYMSPEQADFGKRDIDTRSDIYSLGVMLYELITGTLPLPRKEPQTSTLEVLRRIREDEPEPPSKD